MELNELNSKHESQKFMKRIINDFNIFKLFLLRMERR